MSIKYRPRTVQWLFAATQSRRNLHSSYLYLLICILLAQLVMASTSQVTEDEESEETDPIEVAINAGARGT